MANLIRWNPRSQGALSDPFRPFGELLDEFWRDWPDRFTAEPARTMLRPAMDLIEDEHNYTARIDLPGMTPDDVHVEIDNNTLTISGEMGDTIEREGDRYHYRERCYGTFRRSISLPNTVDAGKIDATFENGVLVITIPKLPEAQPKQIEIKASGK